MVSTLSTEEFWITSNSILSRCYVHFEQTLSVFHTKRPKSSEIVTIKKGHHATDDPSARRQARVVVLLAVILMCLARPLSSSKWFTIQEPTQNMKLPCQQNWKMLTFPLQEKPRHMPWILGANFMKIILLNAWRPNLIGFPKFHPICHVEFVRPKKSVSAALIWGIACALWSYVPVGAN